MTTNAFTWGHSARLRRSTFVASPADTATRGRFVAVTATAIAVSAVGISVLAPLVF